MVLSMVQFVMTHGMNWKLLLSAHNLDSHQRVGHIHMRNRIHPFCNLYTFFIIKTLIYMICNRVSTSS